MDLSRWIRWSFPLMIAVILVGGFLWERHVAETEASSTPHFCTLGGYSAKVGDRLAMTQDGGAPGRDGCDAPDTVPKQLVVGFDCKVRDQHGTVLGSFRPNHPDGTCGLPLPGAAARDLDTFTPA